jgi:hypothetical protein
VIHQVIGVGPLRALAKTSQEPLRPAMHNPGRNVQDNGGALPVLVIGDLNPQIVQRVRLQCTGPHMFTLVKDGNQTEFDDLFDVLLLAEADDPVYVATRGWMSVGDLRLNMMPGWADLRDSGAA